MACCNHVMIAGIETEAERQGSVQEEVKYVSLGASLALIVILSEWGASDAP